MIYRYLLLQTIIPDYRKQVITLLLDEFGKSFHVIAGDEYFTNNLKTNVGLGDSLALIKNYFLFNRKLLIQAVDFRALIKADVVIFELNPRIVTNWIILSIRKMIGKTSILWGHVWPRKGMGSRTDSVRHLMRLMGDKIIVYTETEKNELKKLMPNKNIIAAPNALYSKTIMRANDNIDQINNIIYVGRLIPEKKVVLLVNAFYQSRVRLPEDTKLLIVGEGSERNNIDRIIKKHKLEHCIKLMGHVSDFKKLETFYGSSLISVSPGTAGLALIQSFSFGVPMIISITEQHGPEIDAAQENENCLMFNTDSVSDLSEAFLSVFANKKKWIDKRKKIAQKCAETYSVEAMASKIISALNETKF